MLALAELEQRVPFPFTFIECVIDESSILSANQMGRMQALKGNANRLHHRLLDRLMHHLLVSKEPLNASISTIPPGEIVTLA